LFPTDPWITSAALSSSRGKELLIIDQISRSQVVDVDKNGKPIIVAGNRVQTIQAMIVRLVAQAAGSGRDADLAELLKYIFKTSDSPWSDYALRQAMLDGLARGVQNTSRAMNTWWRDSPEPLTPYLHSLRSQFEDWVAITQSSKRPPVDRVQSIRRLVNGPYDLVGPALLKLISADQPSEVQAAAVRALAEHDQPDVAQALLKAWPSAGPSLRQEIQEAMFQRPSRLPALLDAIEAKQARPNLLDPARIAQLRKLPDAKLRERATKLLASAIDADRQKVVDAFKPALDLTGDVARGRALFRKTCATCHQLENVGSEVGPDLKTNIRDKTPEQLLVAILDPSREVDRRFVNYIVETKSGRSVSGVIAAETATSVTLRRAEKIDEVILRSQIESIADTGKSLMPDGLEKELDKQGLADVIAYLRAIK